MSKAKDAIASEGGGGGGGGGGLGIDTGLFCDILIHRETLL